MRLPRILLLLFALGFGCKPFAQTRPAEEPRQRAEPIPATVSAARRSPVAVVAHNVLPSVVNIQTEATIRRRSVDPFWDRFGIFGRQQQPSYTPQSLGSGFVWSPDGIIVTNNHVIEGASRITVNFNDGTKLPAELIGVDPDSDLAVLRVDAKNLVSAPIGTSSDLMIGETVVAVGNPFGLSGTVTTGVVSALGRSVPSQERGRTFTDFVQTDASINPGNSGGPLLNIEGRVVGINVAIYAEAQGIGFAIPVDRARKVIEDLLEYGTVHSAWIGAVTATLTPEEARRHDLRVPRGALIVRVFRGSPANAAGLQSGDVITAVQGRPVESRESFSTHVATATSSQALAFTVVRNGTSRTVTVRPSDPPATLGLTILDEIAGLAVADERRGVVIDSVKRGSRAAEIGLAAGDPIVGVNGIRVRSVRELNEELIKGADRSSIVLSVERPPYIYNLTFPMGI
ncbi:MAG TPA: trypsin-like peptidase domain-containing protein [Thermoanaerobaculia bacterium]|nr:trypsin-like peptidase domain-containing protein [Thermoanaerobaculia bacterium]